MSNDRLKFRARFRSLSNGGECWQYLELGRVQTFGDQLPGVGWLQVTDWEQWTGLYDSEGKEIYESDLVDAQWDSDEPEIFVIEWGSQGFIPSDFPLSDSKIVGNIYENPELLDA